MNKWVRIFAICILVALLFAVRWYQEYLFDDPLLYFFKSNSQDSALPVLNRIDVLLQTSLRFGLNTIISLGIIWFLFLSKDFIKLAGLLYFVLFIVLLFALSVLIGEWQLENHMVLFYVRRFLIQPLFLLILIPAFYFQKLK